MVAADLVRDAIAQIMAEDEDMDKGPYLIGDVTLMAELTSPEGEVHIFTISNTDMTVWKERGMLMHRLDRLGALAVAHELEDD